MGARHWKEPVGNTTAAVADNGVACADIVNIVADCTRWTPAGSIPGVGVCRSRPFFSRLRWQTDTYAIKAYEAASRFARRLSKPLSGPGVSATLSLFPSDSGVARATLTGALSLRDHLAVLVQGNNQADKAKR